MRELTLEEFWAQFDKEVRPMIEARAKTWQATAVVCFENLQLDSSCRGERTALVVGPNNTCKTPQDCADMHLNDLPSQRQYPVSYALLPQG